MQGHVFHAGAIILLEGPRKCWTKERRTIELYRKGGPDAMWPNLCHHVPRSTQSSHGDVGFVCCMPSTPMRRTGRTGRIRLRSATYPVRTTITRCRNILRYQHYAKSLLKKGYEGDRRRPAFKMCANAAQDTIRNRYRFHQNFVHNPQTSANIAMHMFIMSGCKSNLVVSTHHIA